MYDNLLNDKAGQQHLNQLIIEAEQERFARKAMQAQPQRKPLSQLRSLLVKALSTLTS